MEILFLLQLVLCFQIAGVGARIVDMITKYEQVKDLQKLNAIMDQQKSRIWSESQHQRRSLLIDYYDDKNNSSGSSSTQQYSFSMFTNPMVPLEIPQNSTNCEYSIFLYVTCEDQSNKQKKYQDNIIISSQNNNNNNQSNNGSYDINNNQNYNNYNVQNNNSSSYDMNSDQVKSANGYMNNNNQDNYNDTSSNNSGVSVSQNGGANNNYKQNNIISNNQFVSSGSQSSPTHTYNSFYDSYNWEGQFGSWKEYEDGDK